MDHAAWAEELQRAWTSSRLQRVLDSWLGDAGPLDGGCLVCARAIIRVTGGGSLVCLASARGPFLPARAEHYGARVEGRIFEEKALNFWRALVVALCYKRDVYGMELSVGAYIDYMSLNKVEELYVEGYREYIKNGEWSYGFVGIKSYLESAGIGFIVARLKAKCNLPPDPNDASLGGVANPLPGRGAPTGPAGAKEKTEQESNVNEQHGYRVGQLMPALNLLDKTYGHIFRAKYSEIDMVDVALNNRVLVMMIPSLEKSAQEAENLGKLAIACLRVMMGRNLGADIEGDRTTVLESKATEANYPFFVALDELGYFFSDGIAVMFAQARSLGMSMIAAAQDIEKLTEGSRKAEAGAMLANAVAKLFMRIDDAQSTFKLIVDYLGKVRVAVYNQYNRTAGGFRRDGDGVSIETVERAQVADLQKMNTGLGFLNTRGKTFQVRCLYVGQYLERHKMKDFRLNRFLQVAPLSDEEAIAHSIAASVGEDPAAKGRRLVNLLDGSSLPNMVLEEEEKPVLRGLFFIAQTLSRNLSGGDRGIALFLAAKHVLDEIARQQEEAREQAPPDADGTVVDSTSEGDEAVAIPSMEAARREISRDRAPGATQTITGPDATALTADPLAYLGLGAEMAALGPIYQRRAASEVLIGVGAQQAHAAALEKARQGARAVAAEARREQEIALESQRAMERLDHMSQGLDPAMAAEIRAMMGFAEPLALTEHERVALREVEAEQESDLSGMPGLVGVLGDDEDHAPSAASVTLGYDSEAVSLQREAAAVILEAASQSDGEVVGFKEDTRNDIAAVETVLGGADPATAAREVEQIVASEVTPALPARTGGADGRGSMIWGGRNSVDDDDEFGRLLAGLVD